MGAHLNGHWDAAGPRERLAALEIPTDRPVSTLSGGQRAQVGLGLALAKRPQVLLLDEPVAALDPWPAGSSWRRSAKRSPRATCR